jgi:hypothetical protein
MFGIICLAIALIVSIPIGWLFGQTIAVWFLLACGLFYFVWSVKYS